MFEPWPTTGVPLAVRDDWRSVLQAAAETGTVNIWVAFHGVGDVHDRQVSRGGAFAETCLAVERARAAGLSVGSNVFITTASLPQLDELAATLRRLPVNAEVCFVTAGFLPTPRSRRNETLRPTLADLLPVATRIAELTAPAVRPWWASLEDNTEAAYVRRALSGDWPAPQGRPRGELALVCRPNLDVHSGLAGHHRTRHGNLRTDGIAAVLDRAVAGGRRPDDALWFSLDPLPTPAELAAQHGHATGLGVHPGPESALYLWLDRAQQQAHKEAPLVR
jgi:MoaA/NifB/PqqE/SkfB family radical SAM enzyme